MSVTSDRASLEEQIGQWRAYLRRRRAINGPDVEELETHLRDQVSVLTQAGLAEDEAFLVAVKRMGNLDALSREYALEHSERLWKQLVTGDTFDDEARDSKRREFLIVLSLAVAAGVAVKLPALFGVPMDTDKELPPFYFRNASLFVFPLLAVYFIWKRAAFGVRSLFVALPFAAAAVMANVYPFAPFTMGTGAPPDTEVLSILHLPIALWLAVGAAYVAGRWFTSGSRRMDFVRFTGELVIYFVLIAIGGGILTGITALLFTAIKVEPAWFILGWLIPCGAAGAVLIASWLVEAKQSVIENMAPVLTRLFTPLFTVLLLAFLATMAWTGNPIDVKREVLITFDLLLVLVVGLVLYAASARDPEAPPNFFDGLQLLLVVSALAVDVLALTAIASRISEFGFTPNRVAALGENIILLGNLAWTAVLYARFLRWGRPFAALEQWQIAYLPVYSVWAAFVVVVFPPLFGFR